MSDKRFKVTLTMESEDLSSAPGDDEGGVTTQVYNDMSAVSRHEIEALIVGGLLKKGDEKRGK